MVRELALGVVEQAIRGGAGSRGNADSRRKASAEAKRRNLVSSHAVLTWDQLLMHQRVGRKAARELVEMLAAAHG